MDLRYWEDEGNLILIYYKIVILLSVKLFCELWLVFVLCNIRNINWVLKKNKLC